MFIGKAHRKDREVYQGQVIAIDYETHLISNEHPSPKPVCLSYADKDSNGLHVGMEQMESFLRSILESSALIVAHNVKFEVLVTDAWFPSLRPLLWKAIDQGRFFCTKLYQQLINNISRKTQERLTLSDLVFHYFDVDISESKTDPNAWRLRYSELDGVTKEQWPAEAVKYAIDDSIWALKLYNEPYKQYSLDIKPHVSAECYLNLMAQTGILVDQERVKTLKSELMAYLQPQYDYLVREGYAKYSKKGKLQKQIKKLQDYITTHVPTAEHTASGRVSTSNESMARYIALHPDLPVLQAFEAIAEYEKVLTAFVSRLEVADPVIRTDYNAIVSSGRTSSRASSAYPSVNIQQMPRETKGVTYDVRNCFVPRPGYTFVSIDYSGLELSSTAHQLYNLVGWGRMRDRINSGNSPVDMHSMFAHILKSNAEGVECTYTQFVQNKKLAGYKEFRQLAKPINLGFPGGIGYDTMRHLLARDGINLKYEILLKSPSEKEMVYLAFKYREKYPNVRVQRLSKFEYALVYDELVSIKRALLALYPELKRFLKEGHEKFLTGETKPMKNEFGEWETEPMYRYQAHGVERDWCTYTAICNGYLMQAPAAVGAKLAGVRLMQKYKDDPRVNILAFIHDEYCLEVLDNEDKYAIISDISEIMIDSMQSVLSSVRIAVEAEECGDCWRKSGGRWSKTYWKDYNSKELKS